MSSEERPRASTSLADTYMGRRRTPVGMAARIGLRRLIRNNAPQMAAALSYRTIFSLIPLFVILLVVFKTFAGEEGIRLGLNKVFEFTGLSEISIPVGRSDGGAGTQEAAPASAPSPGAPLMGPLPAGAGDPSSESLSARIEYFVNKTLDRLLKVNFGLITIVGVAVLIYAALSLLIQVEDSFNIVCRAPTGRRWMSRLTVYWTLLTLGSIVLFAGFLITDLSWRFLASMPPWAQWALPALGLVTRLLLTWSLLVFAYSRMPNTRVSMKAAAVGAIISALLWESAKSGLAWFVRSMGDVQVAVYGSLALIPLFLLWVYVTWLIVLFGLEITVTLQEFWAGRLSRLDGTGESVLIDPGVGVVLMRATAERFAQGKMSDVQELARRTGLPEASVARVLDHLTRRGLLHKVPRGNDEEAYALARPPEAISAGEVVSAMHELASDVPDAHAASVLKLLRESHVKALSALSLSSIKE